MITTIQPMNTKDLAGEKGRASKGIRAAIARLIRRRSVVDIVERFQTKHALQEEGEMMNFHPSMNGADVSGASNKNGMAKIARNTEPTPTHGAVIVGRLRVSG